MNDAPTPRTDAESFPADIGDWGQGHFVPASFARQLERENRVFRAAQKACEYCDAPRVDRIAQLERELSAERALADRLAETMRQIADGCNDAWCRDDATVALAAWEASRDQNQTKEEP